MTIYNNPEIYDPSGSVDQLVADGNSIALMSNYSDSYATITANAVYTYTPSIAKTAFNGGFKADVAAATNQTEPTNSGAIINYAILDTVNSKVLHVGESSGVSITAGNPFNVPAFSIKFPAAIAS
tara:strand:+ start:1444 stop:1818 length:375 start_codon:yes stop_codon:yes gene_type:complete